MLVTKDTSIIGSKVILVPYRKEHVEKYHKWMQNEDLQQLTASEPLTLQQEYEMQQSWIRDENKCTFIVLDKQIYHATTSEIDAMIGDTNLFFANDQDRNVAEAEIMIAEPSARGKHYGLEAMILMLLYGIECLGVKQFMVHISNNNTISMKMFEKLNFIEVGKSEVFLETTFDKLVDDQWVVQLKTWVGPFQVIKDD